MGAGTDPLVAYRSLVTSVRWATTGVGAALTFSQHTSPQAVAACAGLIAYAALRTVVPLSSTPRERQLAGIAGEAGIALLAVALSGWWSSPFVFTFLNAIVVAGVAAGFAGAVPLAVALAVITTAGRWPTDRAAVRLDTSGATELFLVALVVAYARRLFWQAELRTVSALSRLSQLSEANGLLKQLNRLAQALPASLDLDQTIASTVEQVRAMLHPDTVAVFLWEPALKMWTIAAGEGTRAHGLLDEADLPVPIRLAARLWDADESAFLVDLATDGPGLNPDAEVGVYAPLVARETLVGVLLLEARNPSGLRPDGLEFVSGLAEQAALAIDNAVWFGRLRTLGAEQERTRIARDLHDRVAQSLAYVAFELERLTGASAGDPVSAALAALRDDVRRVVTEVRDTLSDLRTDVTDTSDLTTTLETFLARVERRSALLVAFEHQVSRSLAVPVERELWRIVQEAVTNVERHAGATEVKVEWTVSDSEAMIAVTDDGRGFPAGASGRLDSYGLLGMRERADAIGGHLSIDSTPGHGTTIRCRVEVP